MFAVVIPTVGRESLKASLDSLEKQSLKDFSVVIVNDGDDLSLPSLTLPCTVLSGPRVGWPGPTRNVGIQWAKRNGFQWIAFLDDDDFFHPKYMEWLQAHVTRFPATDMLIFRARGLFDHIPPTFVIPPRQTVLRAGLVTNSFAIRVGDIEYDEHHVDEDSNKNKYRHHGEDFRLIMDVVKRRKTVFISERVAYGTRMPIDDVDVYPLVKVCTDV